MGKIILLRHGQTHSNIHGYLDTRPPGAELSDLGRKQAHAVGEELSRELADLPNWWSSMAIRTQQTSEIAARALELHRGLEPYTIPVQVTPGLYEVFAGDYEMSQDMGKIAEYHRCMLAWLEGDEKATTPGGETYPEILARYLPAMEQAAASENTTVIASHGTVIRVIARYLTGLDPRQAFEWYLPNCRYIVLDPAGKEFGQWKLGRWGDYDLGDFGSGDHGLGRVN